MAQSRNSLLGVLDKVPPFCVYFLARDSKAALAHPGAIELSRRSGLSYRTIFRISNRTTWESIPLGDIEKFCSACGVSFVRVRSKWTYLVLPHVDYLRKLATGKFKHPLRHLSVIEKKRFDALCDKWAEERTQ